MKAFEPQEPALPDQPLDESEADAGEVKRAVEALLFVAAEPLTCSQLAQVIQAPQRQVEAAVGQLSADYQGRGLLLRQVAGGWQFVTAAEFAPLVERLYRPKFQQLSQAALETLAIIAYKQPITRAEISAIRQVDSDGVVAKLLEKNLIVETGRLTGAGRAILYGTSQAFLEFFGLNSVQELPELDLASPAADERDPQDQQKPTGFIEI